MALLRGSSHGAAVLPARTPCITLCHTTTTYHTQTPTANHTHTSWSIHKDHIQQKNSVSISIKILNTDNILILISIKFYFHIPLHSTGFPLNQNQCRQTTLLGAPECTSWWTDKRVSHWSPRGKGPCRVCFVKPKWPATQHTWCNVMQSTGGVHYTMVWYILNLLRLWWPTNNHCLLY